jgi:AAA family ATP:ADP antiporter
MITAWAFTGLTQGLGLGLGAVAFVGTLIAGVWAFVGYFLGRTYDQGHGVESNHREHRANLGSAR